MQKEITDHIINQMASAYDMSWGTIVMYLLFFFAYSILVFSAGRFYEKKRGKISNAIWNDPIADTKKRYKTIKKFSLEETNKIENRINNRIKGKLREANENDNKKRSNT